MLHNLLTTGDVSKILPVFELAFNAQLYVYEEPNIRDVFDSQGSLLYLTYLYLRDRKVTSDVLNAIEYNFNSMRIPSKDSLKKIRPHKFPSDLFDHLYNLAADIEHQHFYSGPGLRATLDAFVQRGDVTGLEKTYKSIKAIQPSPLGDKQYALILNAFLNVSQYQDKALDVWDDMEKAGVIPGVASWSVFLGYRGSGGRPIVLNLWQEMIRSGVIPDERCWCVRINSQFQAGQVEAGMESFRQMIDSGLKLTIVTVNDVVTGLLRIDRLDQAIQIMAIADSLNVKPDVVTYNTLIKGLMKRSTSPPIMSILKNMQEQGITPDVVTFTVLLDGLFKKSSITPTQKADEAMKLLGYMEELGIMGNIATYTSIIGGLLKQQNVEAVEGIRNIMGRQGLSENAEMYTVMIKAAFEREDIQGVQILWEELCQKNIRRDHILWTELIWGYTQAGEITLMQEAMADMRSESERMVIKLQTYVGIIRALDRRGQIMPAKAIVEHVVDRWNDVSEPVKHDPGKILSKFWHVVGKLGGIGWMENLKARATAQEK
ncbi:hypothetical protein EDC01DRAFT_628072 [Geopyxis carbonaria]|nr:hypothetical protein EDC01DRAFT_628072 [Geopyxis carbonaria]